MEGTVKTSKPYMLCAHMDVVGPGDPKQWSREPFLGDIIKEGRAFMVFKLLLIFWLILFRKLFPHIFQAQEYSLFSLIEKSK